MPFTDGEVALASLRGESDSSIYGLLAFDKRSFLREGSPENDVRSGVLRIDLNRLPRGLNRIIGETDLSVESGKVDMGLEVLGVGFNGLLVSPSGIINPALSLIPLSEGCVGIREFGVDL